MEINSIPPHKRISYTNYVVDCFYINICDASHYFLSHFHADHYYGLKKSFAYPIYCSITTSNLVKLKFKCKTIPLENTKIYKLDDMNSVSLIDANHCPGAVCFIFKVSDIFILHTGDFRCTIDLIRDLLKYNFYKIYLDNTFENYRNKPPQEVVIHSVIDIIKKKLTEKTLVPLKYKFLFCTYSIGKERLFLSIAEYFNWSVKIGTDKLKIYGCYDKLTVDRLNMEVIKIITNYKPRTTYENVNKGYFNRSIQNKKVMNAQSNTLLSYMTIRSQNSINDNQLVDITNLKIKTNNFKAKDTPNSNSMLEKTNKCEDKVDIDIHKLDAISKEPFSRITTKEEDNQIHIISTQHLEKKRLEKITSTIKGDRIVIFCGTGWKDKTVFVDWKRHDGRVIKKGIEIIYVPYSEHSSSSELEYFKKTVRYEILVNTVKNKPE